MFTSGQTPWTENGINDMGKALDKIDASAVGVNTMCAVNNVHDTTPTLAEITTAFGAPSSKGAGFVGTINDNAGGTNFYIVGSDGTNYFFLKMTKAA